MGRAQQAHLDELVAQNIRALVEERRRFDAQTSLQQRIADAITGFTGSMKFVYLHAVVFGGWLLVNGGVLPVLPKWDPYPFVMLAMAASVEAIFLSTFVLISQNRMSEIADRRADLDLQINMLTEQEVTRVLAVVDAVAEKLGVDAPHREEIAVLKQDVRPERVLRELETQREAAEEGPPSSAAPTSM